MAVFGLKRSTPIQAGATGEASEGHGMHGEDVSFVCDTVYGSN
jgi:hypothetical protein